MRYQNAEIIDIEFEEVPKKALRQTSKVEYDDGDDVWMSFFRFLRLTGLLLMLFIYGGALLLVTDNVSLIWRWINE